MNKSSSEFPHFFAFLFPAAFFPFLTDLFLALALAGEAWADPVAWGAAAAAAAGATFLWDLFPAFLVPFFFPILLDPVAFLVLLAWVFFAGFARAIKK